MLIYKLQIMGLSKVRRNGFGELRTPRGLTFLYSGKQDEEYVLRFNSKARKITVIQCYAPTNLASEEDKEDFYRALKLTLKKIRQQNIVIDNDLTIGGTSFIHGDHHKYTWNSPDGVMKNQIDHLAISSKWRSSLLDVRKRLVAEVRLKVALARAASATTKIGKRFEVNKLRDPDVGAAFGLELRNRFSGLEMDSSTSVHAEWNYILLVWNLVESGRVYNFFPIN
ncbi:hypothetical protein MSG28_001892 [Choristoneura fumiferana]|uniref:Uncharacterized protein n=1 Tax=Choristoneura fumiferana TaxID=7141 RepID=A0ACC0JT32_CHOFU|nr:hypothetical protein MSG28_001892 [Choristoneura fumiferana]